MSRKRRRLLVTAAMLMAGAALAALGCGVQGYGWAIASPTPPFDPWEEDIYGPGGATALYVGPRLTTIAPTPTLTSMQRRVVDLLNLSVDFRESRPDLSYLLAVEAVKAAQRNAQADLIARAQTALYEMLTPAGSYVVLRSHTGAITSASFSAGGSRILTTGEDGVARLWTVEGQLLAALDTLVLTDSPLPSASLNRDGSRILTVHGDGLRLWDAAAAPIAALKLEGYQDSGITNAAFSPDGTKVFVASRSAVDLWTADGEFITALDGYRAHVRIAAISPDGARILTAGRDGAARLWPVPASVNEMLAEAERRAGRSLTKAECRQYLNQACP